MATVSKKSATVTTVSSGSKEAKKAAAGARAAAAAGGPRDSRLRPEGTPTSALASASSASVEEEDGGSRSGRRSTSPGLLSRLAEKRELALLNDRLANYIDTVRQLEVENSRLARIVESQETTVRTNVSGIRGLYEDELAAARKLLDEVSADKTKLLVEIGGLKSGLDDVIEKLRMKEAEANDVRGHLRSAEGLLKDMKPKLIESETQKARVSAELENLTKEHNILRKNHETLKKQLEEETLARVDLLNQCNNLKEELSFMKQVHAQELNESITSRTRVIVDEADNVLRVEYDNQLRDALLQMRQEMDGQLHAVREETETVVQKRLEEMGRMSNVPDQPSAALRTMRAELEQLKSRLSQRDSENAMYEDRIRDLEDRIGRERDAHEGEVDSLNADLRRLRGLLDEQLLELKDLMEVKIRLDAEISAYRKLLDNEEIRIGDQPSPYRKSPGEAKKRKLEEGPSFSGSPSFHSSSSSSRSAAVTTVHAEDAVTIDESSSDGSFIKLLNTSDDKNVTLAGWQLKQTANGNETTYKFPRGYELKAKQHVTVWGKVSGRRSSSSNDLLMKGRDWMTGDEVLTELLNEKGEKMAYLETKWTSYASSRSVLTDTVTPKQQKSPSRWGWLPFSSIFTN